MAAHEGGSMETVWSFRGDAAGPWDEKPAVGRAAGGVVDRSGSAAPARALRQLRVTFAGPQLPRTSNARTRIATFAVRLRTGRTIPAVGVLSVAIFQGPLLTEYWTR